MSQVPMPDEIDLFLHNHAVLYKISWLLALLAGYEAARGHWVPTAVVVMVFTFTRSMARLLCHWLHTWAVLHIERQKQFY